MAQNKQHKHQMHPNQPQQQQVQQFLYMVPQTQQRMAGPYGGLSSEELQINTYPVSGMTFSTNSEVRPPSAVAVPPSGDAIPATGGSHPNNGALPMPCDHVQSAENPLTNTGPLSSGSRAALPTVQSDPQYSDPNLVPTIFPTPEEALVPASPPLLSDTVKTNPDLYP
ncbi:hypothetical protein PO909_015516 [Leuciscus waleckii]